MAGKTLDVFYHGKIVGTLAEMPDKRIAFQYSDEWIRDGFAISPLSLPPEKYRLCAAREIQRILWRIIWNLCRQSAGPHPSPDFWKRISVHRPAIIQPI